MNTPPPAVSAAPLHLYDFTHGQRRLTVWCEPDPDGRRAVHAALAVPYTLQDVGQAPQTEWVVVATGRAWRPALVRHCASDSGHDSYQLELGSATFPLLEPEMEPLASYLHVSPADLATVLGTP